MGNFTLNDDDNDDKNNDDKNNDDKNSDDEYNSDDEDKEIKKIINDKTKKEMKKLKMMT